MPAPTLAARGTDRFAAHAVALEGNAPEWVQLLPAGTFAGRDGRGPYHIADVAQVIARTKEAAGDHLLLPIDYGHALEQDGVVGSGAIAAAWIVDLEDRDQQLWGKVEWTAAGARAVADKEFRFLSPVFYHDNEGTVLWLARAGLTNRPNLRMAAVHSTTSTEGDDVPLRESVAAALGLAVNAEEEAVVAACSAAAEGSRALARVAQAAGLQANATADEVVAAVAAAQTPDPTRYVPRSQYDAVATELAAAQGEQRERAVNEAVSAGKITPAQREWAISYHARDPRGFSAFVASAPTIVAQGSDHGGGGGGGGGGGVRELDDDAKAVCATLGISPEEFAANLKEEGA